MRATFIPFAVAAGVMLAATRNLQAATPRPHSVSGVIAAIDCGGQSITLKPTNGAASLTLIWNDGTRFTRKGGCAQCSFTTGQSVRVSYRREAGRNVLRVLSGKGCSPTCGTTSK